MARAIDPAFGPAVVREATRLGIKPVDLATLIGYETIGKYSPDVRGGASNAYLGYIQFGPAEQRKYGIKSGMSADEQMIKVGNYLQDRGLKPGAKLVDIYSVINAGSPGHYGWRDASGRTVAQHAALAKQNYGEQAAQIVNAAFIVPHGPLTQEDYSADPRSRLSYEEERNDVISRKYASTPWGDLQPDERAALSAALGAEAPIRYEAMRMGLAPLSSEPGTPIASGYTVASNADLDKYLLAEASQVMPTGSLVHPSEAVAPAVARPSSGIVAPPSNIGMGSGSGISRADISNAFDQSYVPYSEPKTVAPVYQQSDQPVSGDNGWISAAPVGGGQSLHPAVAESIAAPTKPMNPYASTPSFYAHQWSPIQPHSTQPVQPSPAAGARAASEVPSAFTGTSFEAYQGTQDLPQDAAVETPPVAAPETAPVAAGAGPRVASPKAEPTLGDVKVKEVLAHPAVKGVFSAAVDFVKGLIPGGVHMPSMQQMSGITGFGGGPLPSGVSDQSSFSSFLKGQNWEGPGTGRGPTFDKVGGGATYQYFTPSTPGGIGGYIVPAGHPNAGTVYTYPTDPDIYHSVAS